MSETHSAREERLEETDRLEEMQPNGDRCREVVEMLERYETADADEKKEIRESILSALRDVPRIVRDKRVSSFLATEVEPSDFSLLSWNEPEEVVTLSDTLFRIPFDDEKQAESVKADVAALLRHVLKRYEQERNYESMFVLLKYAPTLSTLSDAELFRLRHRTYLYEMRRVQRSRRLLYAYLVVHALLVLVVFPLLFVNAENGAISAEIEKVTKVDMPTEPQRYYSYADGVYWSLVTAASIGYGDITPVTQIGRIMAAALGVLGVVTVGVVAGLILQWVTPRSLE